MKNVFWTVFAAGILAMNSWGYQMIVAPDAAPAEKTAALELQKYFGQCSKADLRIPILAQRDPSQGNAIMIGQTDDALKALGLSSWSELKPDEVIYRVTADGDLWVAGSRPRGTLYAAYELLEREYGVRFWTATARKVPQQDPFRLPAPGTNYRYAPQFQMRAAAYDVLDNAPDDFVAQMRNNGFGFPRSEEFGGNEALIGWCHTTAQLLPADTYFASHPEWYSMRAGQRHGGAGFQLCFTNHAMRQELIKQVFAWLRNYPEARFISITQNDNMQYCECPECTAFVKAHGNQSDVLLDCINEVADAVAREFPGVYCETLAYIYTREPARTVRPHDNVVIRYCTIGAASLQPLEAKVNRKLYDELLGWKALARQTMIWNYLTDFAHYYLPHPNWEAIGPDLRFYRDCHAISVFLQGSWNHGGPAADLAELRAYFISKLLWNPDQDDHALIAEFVNGYYGPAAPYVLGYLDGVMAAVRRHPECADGCYVASTDGWLEDDAMVALWKAMFEGVRRFENDPVYGPRMAVAALPLTMAFLERHTLVKSISGLDVNALIEWC